MVNKGGIFLRFSTRENHNIVEAWVFANLLSGTRRPVLSTERTAMRNQRDLSYDEQASLSPGFSHGDAEIEPADPCAMRDALDQVDLSALQDRSAEARLTIVARLKGQAMKFKKSVTSLLTRRT